MFPKKSILAAAACAALLPAAASHEFGYGSESRYYDRYGRPYEAPVVIQPSYPAPAIPRGLVYPESGERNWYRDGDGRFVYRPDRESPYEYRKRMELESYQRGEADGVTPHPLSKNYSPG